MTEQALLHDAPVTVGRKIKELPDLARHLQRQRSQGRTVVHCHGVFDPLHIGHIRHFQQARKHGDILVVTVTPDRFVNKGPHRPVFPEQLRAEAIAALECVDYVAVNRWPMAVETIQLLRPDVFVKGNEFQDGKDRLGAIPLEEQAIEAVGGRIAFTDDLTFSASNLVNRHFPVFSREVTDYLAGFASRHGTASVLGHLEAVRPLRVLVIGETIIDEYHYCEAIGKSSKEPTLAVKSLGVERFAGGVLAVANHVAGFSDRVSVVSMLGDLNPQLDLVEEKLNPAIKRCFIKRHASPTIVKRRFIEQYFFTKLFEVYDINDGRLDEVDNAAVCNALREELEQCDVAVVFDFGHSMLSPEAVEILCEDAPFLAVNTQSNAGNHGYHTISKYPRADYVCIAENEMRLDSRDRRGELHGMIESLTERTGCRAAVVTRGKTGCLAWGADEGFVEVPALAGKIVDRVGAGDAFLSITAPCVALGAPMEIVGFIGNVAGAQAVATVGNRDPINRTALVRHIEHLLK